jgi:hypothetical protein
MLEEQGKKNDDQDDKKEDCEISTPSSRERRPLDFVFAHAEAGTLDITGFLPPPIAMPVPVIGAHDLTT